MKNYSCRLGDHMPIRGPYMALGVDSKQHKSIESVRCLSPWFLEASSGLSQFCNRRINRNTLFKTIVTFDIEPCRLLDCYQRVDRPAPPFITVEDLSFVIIFKIILLP
jgi:hypothetical protein